MLNRWVYPLTRFIFLLSIKIFALIFYRLNLEKIGDEPLHWPKIKLVLLLNHTSLFEPLYARFLPVSFLWRMSRHLVFPMADITRQRKFVGFLFALMAPKAVPISRQRDLTWNRFIEEIRGESLIIMLPEGRMKRLNGLDKNGERMTVRGGFYDVLTHLNEGLLLLVYSGGLHHVHAPGQRWPRICQRLEARLEVIKITEYKNIFPEKDQKKLMIADLETRRDRYCPRADHTPWL